MVDTPLWAVSKPILLVKHLHQREAHGQHRTTPRASFAAEERLLAASSQFNREDALAFLGVRMPAEYAALCRVLNELKIRAPSVVPAKTLVFGAGPGTAMWALLEVRSELVVTTNHDN